MPDIEVSGASGDRQRFTRQCADCAFAFLLLSRYTLDLRILKTFNLVTRSFKRTNLFVASVLVDAVALCDFLDSMPGDRDFVLCPEPGHRRIVASANSGTLVRHLNSPSNLLPS